MMGRLGPNTSASNSPTLQLYKQQASSRRGPQVSSSVIVTLLRLSAMLTAVVDLPTPPLADETTTVSLTPGMGF